MLATHKSQDKFLELLRNDVLKLDLADLDFGIYRIFKYRRNEVEDFLTKRLPEKVEASLKGQSQNRSDELQARLDDLAKELETLAKAAFGLSGAFDGPAQGKNLREPLAQTVPGKEYLEKAEALARATVAQGLGESEQERLYNTLYTFFSRYFEDGDFLPQPRRGKRARFSVDYRGEDVHFSWRGRGSHYVKTSEQLRSYAFRVEGTAIRFEFVSADLEKDNVKGDKRYLVPLDKPDVSEKGVTLYFEHRPLNADEEKKYTKREVQDALIEDKLKAIHTQLKGVGIGERDLYTHMRRYARKHTSDYFVHPNLGEFLHGELDYFLKNEYLNPDAFTSPEAVADTFIKFRALRDIGFEIITFLDQIESFQARLFEKRRFVLGSSYLVQVRHLTDEQKNQALENDAQVQAWRELFAVEGTIDKSFVDAHPTLVVDTKHFGKDFELSILAQFDDLDEATDGYLIHAENYGALRTLQPKFAGKVKVIYIDPPYNTGGDGFLYKDDFSKHSTWLTMMEERLQSGRDLLSQDGALFANIGDVEQGNLRQALEGVFGPENFVDTVIWQKKYSPANDATWFSDDHDYLFVAAKDKEVWRPEKLPRTAEQNEAYSNPDNDKRGVWKASDYTSNKSAEERPNLYYPITNPNTGEEVLPSESRAWAYSPEQHEKHVSENRIWWGRKGTNAVPAYKRFLSEVGGIVPRTIWSYEDAGHNQDAVRDLKALFTESPFASPKPTKLLKRVLQVAAGDWVTDFFAGSATTGHAVIEYNRENEAERRFLLVEMGDYFEPVVLPRIQKVMYSPDWKDGKPKEDPNLPMNGVYPDWVERSPRLVKVMRLESYEDSLNALELPQEQSARAKGMQDLFGDEYLLKYLLPTELEDVSEVFLNTEALETPFDYHLRNYTAEGAKNQPVDLLETFNLLMGYHVKRIFKLSGERESGQTQEKASS